MPKIKIYLLLIVLFPTYSLAHDKCSNTTFSFDENIPKTDEFHFKELHKNIPNPVDFKLIKYYLMSNGCGYRPALVSVRNTSSGTTTFGGQNSIAHTASGEKVVPTINRGISGMITETFTVGFGKMGMPILTLLMEEK